ncbi:MAG: HAD family hydrolase [Paludibacteraceae bacterium]
MTIIFDLDGTLVNTIADLGKACNYALAQTGFPTHKPEEYPRLVGNGVNKLIERALPTSAKTSAADTEKLIQRLRKEFIPYYNEHNCDLTTPYESMPEVLHTLKEQGYSLAVASNKYQQATEKVVNHFFPHLFDVVLGERPNVPRKPAPHIVHDILSVIPAEKVLYVGDSLVDINTARNAGVPVAACSWGFVPRQELEDAKPDFLIDQPAQLLSVLSHI